MSSRIDIVPQQEIIPLMKTGRRVGYAAGLIILAIGIILCLTLVFFFIGLPLALFGGLMAGGFAPVKDVTCPQCGVEKEAIVGTKKLKCNNCGTHTLLYWKARKSLSE